SIVNKCCVDTEVFLLNNGSIERNLDPFVGNGTIVHQHPVISGRKWQNSLLKQVVCVFLIVVECHTQPIREKRHVEANVELCSSLPLQVRIRYSAPEYFDTVLSGAAHFPARTDHCSPVAIVEVVADAVAAQ